MGRVGRYGERRVVIPGINDYETPHIVLADGVVAHSPMGEFGDINYQATTRGGRKMDGVLGRQALYKGVTNTVGDSVMIAAGAVPSPVVALGLLAAGGIMKLVAVLMHPEADIRYWGNLPYEFEIVPLKLPLGNHVLTLAKKDGAKLAPIASRNARLDSGDSFTVVHFRPVPNK